MIISITDLKKQIDCGNTTDEQITARLKAIEGVIRAYTNNNFQQHGIRFAGHSDGMKVYGNPQYIIIGDTIQISGSNVNDGLYQVTDVKEDSIQVDSFLHTTNHNIVTKIQYPPDVIQCAVEMFKWKQTMGDKIGIQSETLSRHSVTYFNQDAGNQVMGYPASLLGCLKAYRKARF